MIKQRTLKTPVRAAGVGLHSGVKVEMTLRPAAPNLGIVFRRMDLDPPAELTADPAHRSLGERLGSTLRGLNPFQG